MLQVSVGDKVHQLRLTPDTTLIDGDKGFIDSTDINFDSVSDLAVTTSFGTPNLYLDYWIYSPEKEGYVFIGNYPAFEVNGSDETLRATVKVNAASYESKTWQWDGFDLVEVMGHE